MKSNEKVDLIHLPNLLNLLKPAALKKGDKVGLVCPASRPDNPVILAKVQKLVEEMGFQPILGEHVLSTHGSTAGTAEERLGDLESFFADPSISALFCITGGFGSMHLLSCLNYEMLRKNPKIIVGGEDNSALLLGIHQMTNMVVFHGPNLDEIKTKYTFDKLVAAVTAQTALKSISINDCADQTIIPAVPYASVAGDKAINGPIIGGSLTALISLFGTPYQPDLKNHLLFLTDKNERTDILDRWFTTLYVSDVLAELSGVIFGQFENCGPRGNANILSWEELFSDRLKQLAMPGCFGFPIGQGGSTACLPVGIKASMDMKNGVLEFLESALS